MSWVDLLEKIKEGYGKRASQVEDQGGIFPSMYPKEFRDKIAEKQYMMGMGEFRPITPKESGLMRLLKEYQSRARHPNLQNKALQTKENILKNFKESDVSPQVAVDRIARAGAESIWGDLRTAPGELKKDFSTLGYEVPETHPYGIWDQTNKILQDFPKPPEMGYHNTQNKNLSSIAQEGLISGKRTLHTPQTLSHPQRGKVFLAEEISSPAWKSPNDNALLRTKMPEDAAPDVYGGRGAWQTRKPIPSEALEIQSTEGNWIPLLEYLKGKKP